MWLRGNQIVAGVMGDRDRREASKEFTELVLTPEMRAGAIWNRSYAKPMGYPGDFQIMNQVYSDENVGKNVYEKLVHRLGLHVAECIDTRMQVVRSHIAEVVRNCGHDRPARILSLGSGPAREVELYLSGTGSRAGRAEFTLVDQETQALEFAYDRAYPHLLKSDGANRVNCLNISFTDVLRPNGALSDVPPQDMIYSVGLLDYLTDRRSKGLVQKLYAALAPKGLLIIGNMNETPLSNLWPMEFIADWTLDIPQRSGYVPLGGRASELPSIGPKPNGRAGCVCCLSESLNRRLVQAEIRIRIVRGYQPLGRQNKARRGAA